MFEVGEFVVHPQLGLAKVKEIREIEYGGEKIMCYVFEKRSAVIEVPVDQADSIGLRKPIDSEKIDDIWKILKSKADTEGTSRRDYSHSLKYVKKFNKGDIVETAEVLRDLKWLERDRKEKGRNLSNTDKKLMEEAEQMLVEELSFIQETGKSQVLRRIKKLFENKFRNIRK